eukprot:TRINITY_DN16240_c0_g1_i1.p1 TRINITY_DN16240_c0_g1~~TRINITY_DN16240_c0_g1_i1.p1  ORF type:complete len:718 (-),score=147.90 TRINITY_DN16240_c0_g1_i1:181-2334(-)
MTSEEKEAHTSSADSLSVCPTNNDGGDTVAFEFEEVQEMHGARTDSLMTVSSDFALSPFLYGAPPSHGRDTPRPKVASDVDFRIARVRTPASWKRSRADTTDADSSHLPSVDEAEFDEQDVLHQACLHGDICELDEAVFSEKKQNERDFATILDHEFAGMRHMLARAQARLAEHNCDGSTTNRFRNHVVQANGVGPGPLCSMDESTTVLASRKSCESNESLAMDYQCTIIQPNGRSNGRRNFKRSSTNRNGMSFAQRLQDIKRAERGTDFMDLLRGRAAPVGLAGTAGIMRSHCRKSVRAVEMMFMRERICLESLLRSPRWELLVVLAILTNTLFMGIEVDVLARYGKENDGASVVLIAVSSTYTAFFFLEVILRLLHQGRRFFYPFTDTVCWNLMDTVIVGFALFETCTDTLLTTAGSTEGMDNVVLIKVFRFVRMTKIFRIARLTRFMPALRTLIMSLAGTMKSAFWAIALMNLTIYMFALVLTQSVVDYHIDKGYKDKYLEMFFGTVLSSMFTLSKAILGGISWHEVVLPLEKVNSFCVLIFLVYVGFMYFAVVNVVTAVFCESAIQTSKMDEDLAIQQQLSLKELYRRKLEVVFHEVDTDGSSMITAEELESYLEAEMSGAFFEYLELDVKNAKEFLALLTTDRYGGVNMEQFIDGVSRLRGHASALELAQLTNETRTNSAAMLEALRSIEERITHVGKLFDTSFPDPEVMKS